MARIPDSTDLGSRVIAQRRAPEFQSRAGVIEAEALTQAAAGVGQAVRRFQAHDDEFNYARAKSALLQADAEARKTLENDPDWATHETRYNEAMKTAREEAGKQIKGGRSRALFDEDAKASVLRGQEVIRSNAKRVEGQWGRGELDTTLEGNRRAALETKDEKTRGALVFGTLEAITGAQNKGYITPEQAVHLRQVWTAQYGEGFVDMQAEAEQMRLLKNPKGTPAEYIDPAKRAVMIDRLEDKIRIASDRREARAERALAQWERHTATGIPATPEMRAEWTSLIKGTSVEGELNDLLAGEKEVQETLRKPIGEQLRLVQERKSALMKTGGTTSQAANVARLENAVNQNVALLQKEPLLFVEQRLNTPILPMDVSQIMDPTKQAETAAAFQERAAQIRTVSRRFQARVPMKPFLPQEAAQITTLLAGASRKESAELLAQLRESAGSPDVFKAMMQQVAPDAPVKSFAGLLAANQREMNLGEGWFRADKFVSGKDVAATLLRGEEMLNPSKAEKGEDGRSKTAKLYLPSAAQTDLQTKFEAVVGDAFAGREEVANNALQAVQAYYVGRAAELGKLAGDSESVDAALVREAVQATLGAAVDYNGNGKALAPWGMAEDDFEDRVEGAIKALKLPEDMDIDDLGITNADGDGRYALTVGRRIQYDEKGNPIIIDIRPRDPRNQRGYIDRSAQ
jgi:hypothetical protein